MQVALSRRHSSDTKDIPTLYNTVVGRFADIHRVILANDWSPSLFAPKQSAAPRTPEANLPYRCKATFLEAQILALDIDDGASALEAHDMLLELNLTHVIAATRSHQTEKHGKTCDRYRIIIPAEKPATRTCDYHFTARYIGEPLRADKQSYSPVQSYRPSTEILHSFPTGNKLDWLIAPYATDAEGAEHIEPNIGYYLKTFDPYKIHTRIVESLRTAGNGEGRNRGLFRDSIRLAVSGAGEDEILRLIEAMKSPYLIFDESWNQRELLACIRNGVAAGRKTRADIEQITHNQ